MAQPEIHPLTEPDLKELGEFLVKGFHAPADSAFASEDVLRWKYFQPRGIEAGDAPRGHLARDPQTQRIVGHLGVCRGRFHGPGLPAEGVSTLHMIDWLSSEEGRGSGGWLMRRAHQSSRTQYALGATTAARGVMDRAGYDLVARVPVYHRVLRPFHRLKDPSHVLLGRGARVAKDLVRTFTKAPHAIRSRVEVRRIDTFGDEILPILRIYKERAVFTTREPDLLNHFLRYPRGGLTGWHVWNAGVLQGFAVLSVVPGPGGVKVGKIADCLLDDEDGDDWHAAVGALTGELKSQGADLAVVIAANAWTVHALEASGFTKVHDLEFRLRDRGKIIPPGTAFHLTSLEADYAYT